MSTQIKKPLQLEVPIATEKSLAYWNSSAQIPSQDLGAAITHSLKNPVEFPPIETAIIPDDKVCLAIEPDLPQLPEVVCEVVNYLVQESVLPRNIDVLVAGQTDCTQPVTAQLTACNEEFKKVNVVHHDPVQQDQVAYLAAAKNGEPIYLNRILSDADVVIPICVAKPDKSDWRSEIEYIYPRLSNAPTIASFREREQNGVSKSTSQACLDDAQEAIRNLGVLLNVQIVPGPNHQVGQVIAGERKAAIAAAQQAVHRTWHREVKSECDLVVADIGSARGQRSWSEVLDVASRFSKVLASGGSIVICTRFGSRRNTTLKNAPTLSKRDRKRVEQLLEDCHIYLYSDLTQDDVESLGFGFIDSNDDIEHLAGQAKNCLVVPDADWATVSIVK